MSDSSTYTPTAGQPNPTPADFPVSWDDPAHAKLTWALDNRATEPMTPLSHSAAAAALRGFNSAYPQLGMPIQLRVAFLNGFPYVAVVPTAAPPEAVMKTIGAVNRVAPAVVKLLMGRMAAGMEKQQLEKLDPILARLDTYWRDELLPEIRQHLAYLESCDLRGLSQEQLRAHFAEGLKRTERVIELHARATFPAMIAVGLFEDLYRELFEGATPLDAMRLLQGFDNQTLAGDRALWQLSRAALTMPGVRQTLAECAAADVSPALEQSSEGRRFLADLRAYLNQYGQRFLEIAEPSWIEDPTPVIEILKAYLTRPDTRPEAEQARLAAERENAIAEARSRLAGYPQPVVRRFETLLKAAQSGTGIKEDSHWSVLPLFYQIRRLALEFGGRLAEAGTLETVDDVFYLTSDELLDGGGGGVTPPIQQRVKERKAELERFRHMTPPPMLGTMPLFVPDDSGPFSQLMKKGDMAIWSGNGGDAQGLHGSPGSAGVVRGTARVIRSLAEAGKLQPGDVLVTKMTTPPWTPLFATAVAVVTDTGGVLSHAAIVAREYRIPAVVGTGRGTKTFHDGQLLEVDGTAGVVRVLDN
jgi:phosphohistidine swiveling domain-containing protein